MDENDKKRLQIKRTDLLKQVDQIQLVVDFLYSKGILNEADVEQTSIEGCLRSKAVRYVLDVLPRKGKHAFCFFCEALRFAEQEWLADDLEAADPSEIIDELDCVPDIVQHPTTPVVREPQDLSNLYNVTVIQMQLQIHELMKELEVNKDRLKILEQQASKDDEQHKALCMEQTSLLSKKNEINKQVKHTVKNSWFGKWKHSFKKVFHMPTSVEEVQVVKPELVTTVCKGVPPTETSINEICESIEEVKLELATSVCDGVPLKEICDSVEEVCEVVTECALVCESVSSTKPCAIEESEAIQQKIAIPQASAGNKPQLDDGDSSKESQYDDVDGHLRQSYQLCDDDIFIKHMRNFFDHLPKLYHKPKKMVSIEKHRPTSRKLKTLLRKLFIKANDSSDVFYFTYKTKVFQMVWDLFDQIVYRIDEDWNTILDGFEEMAEYLQCDDSWMWMLCSDLCHQLWKTQPNWWTVLSMYFLTGMLCDWVIGSAKPGADTAITLASIESEMGTLLATKVAPWLAAQGGWEKFVEFLQVQTKDANTDALDIEAMNLILTLMTIGSEERKDNQD